MPTLSARLATVIATTVICTGAAAQSARDQISIVGSSTVYPFATVVAERFGQTTKQNTKDRIHRFRWRNEAVLQRHRC